MKQLFGYQALKSNEKNHGDCGIRIFRMQLFNKLVYSVSWIFIDPFWDLKLRNRFNLRPARAHGIGCSADPRTEEAFSSSQISLQ